MKTRLRSVILLVTEFLIAVYLSLVVYLLSTWMVDDAVAARMAATDWHSTAARRLGLSIVVGAALAGVVHEVNRRWIVAPFGAHGGTPHERRLSSVRT